MLFFKRWYEHCSQRMVTVSFDVSLSTDKLSHVTHCTVCWLQYVPLVVEVCTQVVEERGLANQGIYRVPGNSLAINNLVEELNRVSSAV